MIKNEREYRITKAQAAKFERALSELGNQPHQDIHPLVLKAQEDALRSQYEELHEQIKEYEGLKSGASQVLELSSLKELPEALIKARIASGLSQKDLAEKLGLKEQQIQRYEATEYESASLHRLQEVIAALGVKIREEVTLPSASTFPRSQQNSIEADEK